MVIKPKKEGDLIYFDKVCVNVKEVIGLSPDEFLKIFECFSNRKDGLKITKICFKIKTKFLDPCTQKRESNYYILNEILEFVFLCKELKLRSVKTNRLINEFNKSQNGDIDEIRHNVTVARICYEYMKKGYRIILFPRSINKKNPDLKLNGLYADIKVKQEEWNIKLLEYRLDITSKIGTIYAFKPSEVMKKDIESKVDGWFKDRDAIFYDISYAITEGGYGHLNDSRTQQKIIEPIKNRVIMLSYSKSLNLYKPTIKWSYLDWDPLKNELV